MTLSPAEVLEWLLQPDNPSVRLFALDGLVAPRSEQDIQTARTAIMCFRPVRAILTAFETPGYWDAADPEKARDHVVHVLLLGELGADPRHPLVHQAGESLLGQMRPDGAFESRHPEYPGVRTCYQGLIIRALAQFDFGADLLLEPAIHYAANMRFECPYNDGLACAWGVIKLLRAMAALPHERSSPVLREAIARGSAWLARHDLRQADFPCRAVSPEWFKFGFPRGHRSDILETLDTLAILGYPRDRKFAAAVDYVIKKQNADGKWVSEYVSPRALELGVDVPGRASKWVTLSALRVCKWWLSSKG